MVVPIDELGASLRMRLREPRFWIVQGLVLAISAAHTAVEWHGFLRHEPSMYLLPISTYFIPVLYAALNFGVEGALPTGLLCVVLSIPNIVFFHSRDARFGVIVQLLLLVSLGVVVALHVDREKHAKQMAEQANTRLAQAQESLQAYVGIAMLAHEEERQRLSRELHDETIQDLVVVRGAVSDIVHGTAPNDRLAVITGELDKAISGIRRICRALRPSVLDDLGLVAALEGLVAETGSRAHVQAAISVVGEPIRFSAETELAIYRVVQEALHNIERHAHAKRAQVRLTFADAGVRVEIADDGRGFDPSRVPQDRLGLAGMRERARLIGGSLRIERGPGRTAIVLDMPGRIT